MMGADLVYRLVNAIFAYVSGRQAQDMVGKPFAAVFRELVCAPVHARFLAVHRSGAPCISQPTLVRIHPQGATLDDRYFTYNLSPLRMLAGEVYGLMVMVVNITVQVEALAQVEKRNIKLHAAARAKDEFLAQLRHVLRNPLAPVVSVGSR